MMKRTLSLLLCLVMVLGFAAPAVQASGTDNDYSNIMDNIVIEDGANVDVVVNGETVSTSQDSKLPNPADLVAGSTDLPYTFGAPVSETPVVEAGCKCVDLASAVEHSGVCLVKAPYMELCEASAEELFAQWGTYSAVEQSFMLEYLHEAFPLKHFDLQKLLTAPTGAASETLTDGTTVSVEGIPQDGSLTVGEAADEVKDIVDAYVSENAEASSPLFGYDVSVQDGEGADWQPDTNVKMELELPGEKLHKNTKVFVVHVDDNGVATTIEAEVTEDGKIAFETPGFSAFYGFTVDFHYEDVVFSIPGMSSIKLSELFEELKVPLNASDVVALEYTDDTQLKIEQLEGDWLLTSLKAFDTEEKLTMTMADGSVYEIKVTDLEVMNGTHKWHIYNGYYGSYNHIYCQTRFQKGDSYPAGTGYNSIFNGTFYSASDRNGDTYYWDDDDDSGPTNLFFDDANQNTTVNLRSMEAKETVVIDMVTEYLIRNGANVTFQISSDSNPATKTIIIRSADPSKPLFSIVNGSLTIKGSANTKIVLDFGANSNGTPKATTYPLIWENGKDSAAKTTARSLYLENVTFRNAVVGAVDMYYSQMTNITLKNCSFESSVDSSSHGGAIRHRSNAYLAVTKFEAIGCTFDGNTSGYRGGAIAMEKDIGTFTITDCKFSNCVAGSHGGAISLQGNVGSISITGTKGTDGNGNTTYTTSFVNCSGGARGGAVAANCDSFGDITVENILVSGNEAGTVTGGLHFGRADGTTPITGGDVSISGCDFKDNMAHGIGGGLAVTDGTFDSISVTSCTFDNCDSTGYGGAIGLKEVADGGSMPFAVKGDIKIIGCTFTNCLAGNLAPNAYVNKETQEGVEQWDHDNDPSTPDIDQLNGASGAGAIIIGGDVGGVIEITGVDADHPMVFENCVTWNNGGAIFFTDKLNVKGTTKTVTDPETGAQKTVADKAVTLQYVKFDKCFARDAGSAVYFSSSVIPMFDAKECLFQYCGYFDAEDPNFPADLLEINEEWFSCQAIYDVNGYNADGTPIRVKNNDKTAAAKAEQLARWLSYDKEDFYPGTDYSGTFRTVGNTACVAQITDCDFNYNRSYSNGGGVYWNANRVVYTDSTNTTIHVAPSLTITNTDFDHNYAIGFGGAIFCEGSVTVESCELSYNEAGSHGGAIAQNVYNNSSRQLGESGAKESTSLILKAATGGESVKIHHNSAANGGGIAITVKATDSYPHTVKPGTADKDKDKPANWNFKTNFTYAVDFQLGGSHVYENTATINGGGIFYETTYYLENTETPADGVSWAERQRQVDSFVKDIKIDDGLIYSNSAGYGATESKGGGNGGGVYMNSNQVNTPDNIPAGQLTGSSTVTITGGEIYKNCAYIGNGGGVYLQGVNALCTISGDTTTIGAQYLGTTTDGKANLSTDGANVVSNKRIAQNNYVGGCGGGIAIFGGARIEMEGGYIVNNVAHTAGGGVAVHGTGSSMYLHDGYIDGNESSHGGGISLNGASGNASATEEKYKYGMYFDGGIVRNNIASYNQDNLAYGGGICLAASATMRLDGGQILDNKAVTDSGDGINTFAAGQEGGGIAVCQGSTMNVYGGTIQNNKAYNGGGIVIRGASTVNMYPVYQLDSNNNPVTDKDGNPVLLSQGLIDTNTASGMGGGVYGTGATLYMQGGTISNNRAYHGAGAYFTASSNVTVDGATVSGNIASDRGGGWYLRQTLTTLNGGTVSGNTAKTGGGIRIEGRPSNLAADLPTTKITGGIITGNTATSDGGGIWMQNYSNYGVPSMEIYGGEISNNTSSASGGGIFVHGSGNTATSLKMYGGTVSGNTCSARGGGINADNYATVELSSYTKDGKTTYPTVTDNTGKRGGGIAVCYGCHLTVKEGFITYNTAEGTTAGTTAEVTADSGYGVGGGIWVANGAADRAAKFTLDDEGQMAIYGNIAEFAGDDVFSNGINTQLEIPQVNSMNLAGYGFNPEGWFEDYNTNDSSYITGDSSTDNGLKMLVNNGTNTTVTPILRYRNANAVQRRYMHINPEHTDGKNYIKGDGGTSYWYVNRANAYVAMTLGIPAAADDTVVIDYVTAVNINLWQNDLFMETSDFQMVNDVRGSFLGKKFPTNATEKDGVYFTSGKDGAAPVGTGLADNIYMTNGNAFNGREGVITYNPKTVQITNEEHFFYTVKHNDYWYYANVTVVPAATLYFDDTVSGVKYHTQVDTTSDQLETWETVGTSKAYVQAEDRPGVSILEGLDADNVYGFDSGAYASTTKYSNGGAHKVTVSRHTAVDANGDSKCDDCGQAIVWNHTYSGGSAANAKCSICLNTKDKHTFDGAEAHTCSDTHNYNEYCDICSKWIGTHTKNARASFTFTGTGFDIISLCNKASGLVMVSVYKGTVTNFDDPSSFDKLVTSYMVDNYYNSGDTLYQVPVIKSSGLPYDTYTVELYVAPSYLPGEHCYWSGDFYLDAIRIYDPAGINGSNNEVISNAYAADGEAWPVYQELRMLFLKQTDLKEGATIDGMLFIDGSDTPTIADYKSFGPNNEVYLQPEQSIAFTMNATAYSGSIDKVHLGLRGLTGKSAAIIYSRDIDASSANDKMIQTPSLSTTDMYYDVSKAIGKVMVVYNSGTRPIAISNLKVTHTEAPPAEANAASIVTVDDFTVRAALDILTPEVLADPALTPKYPALSFEGMVCYNVFFDAQDLGDLTEADLGLAVFDTEDTNGTVETAKDVIYGATKLGDLYMVATNGVNAKYLGDTQYFRAFAKQADGSYIYSKMVSYSALDYAKSVLAKDNDVALKQLVVAMLNYGAEAQKFFGYKTDDLMNKDLTADDQALLTGFDASSLNSVGKVDASKVGAFGYTGGFTRRTPAISFKGAFEINYFFTPANAVDGDMTLYFWNEDTYNSVSELTADNADKAVVMTLENGSYTASSDEIAAKYLDKTVYVAAVYESDGVTYCSGVLPYSIAAYCQKPPVNVQALANAAAIYGCTAKQFFGA